MAHSSVLRTQRWSMAALGNHTKQLLNPDTLRRHEERLRRQAQREADRRARQHARTMDMGLLEAAVPQTVSPITDTATQDSAP